MRRRLGLFIVAACLIATVAQAGPASEVVVAIRYLQAEGESHSHLYLYREDGTLLRQLTKEERGQDLDPMFAQDGETIVFTRDSAAVVRGRRQLALLCLAGNGGLGR